jgi:hypothetical protein
MSPSLPRSQAMQMRCSACQLEIPDDSTQCPSCGGIQSQAPAPRKARRRSEADVEADLARTAAYNRQVKRLVLLTLVAIIPGLGLVLAPAVLVLISLLLLRGKGDPLFTAGRGARVTLIIAALTMACNWVGLYLIVTALLGGG